MFARVEFNANVKIYIIYKIFFILKMSIYLA